MPSVTERISGVPKRRPVYTFKKINSIFTLSSHLQTRKKIKEFTFSVTKLATSTENAASNYEELRNFSNYLGI